MGHKKIVTQATSVVGISRLELGFMIDYTLDSLQELGVSPDGLVRLMAEATVLIHCSDVGVIGMFK
jgi:hypothetical protein